MKVSEMLEAPCVQVLLFIRNQGEVRYSKLSELISSRGTLSLNLKHLEREGLIQRRVVVTKPIQSFYSLTEKGAKVARKLADVKKTLQG